MVKKRYVSASARGFIKGKQKGDTQTMGWEYQCTDIYETPCFIVGDPPVETCQDPIKVGEECDHVWVEEPENPEPEDPCDDPANFWMCNPDNPDPEDPWKPEQEPPLDTLNNVQDSCLKATLDMALDTGLNNTMTQIMRNTFLSDHNLMLTFEDVTSLHDTISGQYEGLYTDTINGKKYLRGDILLNRNKLPSASQEYTAAIIYHEVLHAYFQTWGGLMTSSYQHQYMASEYTNRLTAALMSMFPGLDQADANALACSGLRNTPYWNNLKNSVQRADILNRVNNFRNGTKGNKCN